MTRKKPPPKPRGTARSKAIVEALSAMGPGDQVWIHETDCKVDAKHACTCMPEIWAPMGRA